jgi:hypothetical protein
MPIVECKRRPPVSANFDWPNGSTPTVKPATPVPRLATRLPPLPRPAPAPALTPAPFPSAARAAASTPAENTPDLRPASALILEGQIVPVDGQQHKSARVGLISDVTIFGCGLTLGLVEGGRLIWIQTKGFRALNTAQALIDTLRSNCWFPAHQKRKPRRIAARQAGGDSRPEGQGADSEANK